MHISSRGAERIRLFIKGQRAGYILVRIWKPFIIGPMDMDLFFELHSNMPRQGPGCEPATRRAFECIPNIPQGVRVLDVGCGPGAQTVDLARLVEPFGGEVVAVDFHEQFLAEAGQSAEQAGLKNITFQHADMNALPFDDASFDIIWSEGAIYIMGFENGLTKWKRLLKPGGTIAVTELSWLKEEAPDEARKFWDEGYPAMQTIAGNLEIAERCGYRVLDHFTLPESAWLDNYYGPLEKRLERFKNREGGEELIAMETAEINLYRSHSDCYGYEFFILQP